MDALTPTLLRSWLMDWQFWWLELLFLIFITTSVLAVPPLVRAIKAPLTWWIGVVALALAGVAATYWVAPHTNRIYYDEQIYQHAGQNMADLHRTQMCNYGIVEYGRLQCSAGEYNKEPYGYPHILSVGYRLFGTSDTLAHHVNRWLHGLLALVLALTLARWSGRLAAGLLAALIVSMLPEQLRWSATAAAEPSAAFFASLAVLAAVEFTQSRTTRALVWLVAAAGWAIQMRPESIMVVPVVGLIVLLHAPSAFRERRLWVAAAAGLVVIAAYGLHLGAVRNESWGAGGSPFSLDHLWMNLPVNGWFYFADHRFPFWLGPLAVIGLVAGSAPLRARLSLAAYFLPFWGVFLFFYAGSYNYGADVRYSLVSYVPVVLLGALGITALVDRLAPARHHGLTYALTTAAIGWVFVLQAPHTRSVGEEAWAARADVAFARAFADRLEPDALVLTHNPNMFLLWGVNAAQLHFAADPGFLHRAEPRHGRNVYIHWGFWCNVDDPALKQMCETTLTHGTTALEAESHERNYRFAFYRAEAQPR
jgi:hypothetical protein